jgi:hypothetical protein
VGMSDSRGRRPREPQALSLRPWPVPDSALHTHSSSGHDPISRALRASGDNLLRCGPATSICYYGREGYQPSIGTAPTEPPLNRDLDLAGVVYLLPRSQIWVRGARYAASNRFSG